MSIPLNPYTEAQRWAIIRIYPELLQGLITREPGQVTVYMILKGGLPNTARIVSSTKDEATGTFQLTVEDDSFALVPFGEALPILPAPEFEVK